MPFRLGREIAQADAVTMRALVKQYGGRLPLVAAAAGIPWSTLIRTWGKNKVISVWYEADGRKAPRAKRRKARAPKGQNW